MQWLRKKISDWQSRPYEARVRLWRRSILLIGLLMLLGLIMSVKFRSARPGDTSVVQDYWEILKNFQKLKPPTQ